MGRSATRKWTKRAIRYRDGAPDLRERYLRLFCDRTKFDRARSRQAIQRLEFRP